MHPVGFIIKEIRYDARSHERKKTVKIMCGSDEPNPYPVRSFTYLNEVQRVMVYSTFVGLSYKYGICPR